MISVKFQNELKASGWFPHLEAYFNSPNWSALSLFLAKEFKEHTICPAISDVFRVLSLPLTEVKAVVVGQDPYHGPGQANGLAFAVNPGHIIPPSLRNVLKEVESDLGISLTTEGTLLGWHDQGVMLLNSFLTVRLGQAGSHAEAGWKELTDLIIKTVSEQSPRCVFILWGAAAKSKKPLINNMIHGIIESGHPSPLSCKLFFGTKPFSKTNDILKRYGIKPINWSQIDRK